MNYFITIILIKSYLKLYQLMSRLLRKILVANRGEIACRIIRTAKRYIQPHTDWEFRPLLSILTLIDIPNLQIWQTRPTESVPTPQVADYQLSSILSQSKQNSVNSSGLSLRSSPSRIRIPIRKCIICLKMCQEQYQVYWTTSFSNNRYGKQK